MYFCCFRAQFLIFLHLFSWVQKYVWKDVMHTVILALKKIKQFFFQRILKKNTLSSQCNPGSAPLCMPKSQNILYGSKKEAYITASEYITQCVLRVIQILTIPQSKVQNVLTAKEEQYYVGCLKLKNKQKLADSNKVIIIFAIFFFFIFFSTIFLLFRSYNNVQSTAVSVLQFRSVNFVNMAHSTERA